MKFLVLSTAHRYPILVSFFDRTTGQKYINISLSCQHAYYRCRVIPTFFLILHAAAILLTHMPESYVFATIREMIDDTSHFLPVSRKDYYTWCKTYSFFVEKMFPATHKVMEKCGALDPQSGLDPIFKRFFCTILRREVSTLLRIDLFVSCHVSRNLNRQFLREKDVLRFMDVFVIEGQKAIFRLALSLLQLIPKKDLTVSLLGFHLFINFCLII